MEIKRIGEILIALGVLILTAGVLLLIFPQLFAKFGTLPGDIRWKGPGFKLYIPITSMLIVSLLLTLIVNLIFRGRG